ncbi:hypothetical protein BTH42_32985 [Burkholderia sp. SRS-W-2-2016]|uniref:hypothetical protein n=1 Tax=Burkholderia sp. SRS-W-2-2016 TaxID=1926878 RepID=UPI00094ABF43|nr:hypothetical protein [Burkholderia sp. SRS-W-2-2016]OLL27418.1 hypothetical protein BTH42_32985 [Burkholderia sp. SRS-W-2-2016]
MSDDSLIDWKAGARAWAEQFGSAPLSLAHAAALVVAAHATVQAVGTAADALDWLAPDTFTSTLQQLEPSHAR